MRSSPARQIARVGVALATMGGLALASGADWVEDFSGGAFRHGASNDPASSDPVSGSPQASDWGWINGPATTRNSATPALALVPAPAVPLAVAVVNCAAPAQTNQAAGAATPVRKAPPPAPTKSAPPTSSGPTR